MSNTRSMPSRSNTPDTKEATTTRKSHAIFIIAVIIFGVSIVNVASIRKYIVERGAEPTLSNTVSRASYFAESGAELAIGTDIASRSSSVAIKSTVNDTTDNQVTASSVAVKSTFNDTADNQVTASSVAVKSTVNDTCPEGQFYMQDRVDTDLSDHPDIRLIPNVLYQTSKDRCLTNAFNKGIDSWRDAIPGLLNVFHDDAAMDELLSHSKWEADFPNLKYFLKCANHVNVPVLKADVWRYLIVWENGGIYADLDVKPEYKFNSSTIHDDDDSFFTIDGSTGTISQYFFAASPRHPILYNAVHAAIDRVLTALKSFPPQQTGPGALKVGHIEFLNSTIGAYHLNRTTLQTSPIDGRRVRIEPERGLLNRAYVGNKKNLYLEMGMKHYHQVPKVFKYPGRATCWKFLGLPSYPP